MTTTQDSGCVSCGKPMIKVPGPSVRQDVPPGVWVHVDSADAEYCDEVAKPAFVLAILDKLQAERMARIAAGQPGEDD
jgi:hypothetical protein